MRKAAATLVLWFFFFAETQRGFLGSGSGLGFGIAGWARALGGFWVLGIQRGV